MILDNLNTIFIHVPKTSGNTLQRNIFQPYSKDKLVARSHQDGKDRFGLSRYAEEESRRGEYNKHMSIEDYKFYINIKDYKVITVYRDPVERLISLFFSPHRWYVAKKRAIILKLLNNTIGSGLDYTEHSFRRLKPSFNITEFESLVNNTDSFSEYMRGYSEVSNLILIRFDQIVEDMTASASLIGISKKVIKQGLAEKLNVSEKHITTQQYSQARNIVQSSKHSEDYLMFDKIRRDFRQSWDK